MYRQRTTSLLIHLTAILLLSMGAVIGSDLETEQVPARWRELGVPGALDAARPLDPLAWKKYFIGLNQRLGKGKASPEDVAIVTHYLQKNGAHPEFRAWFAMVLVDFSRSKHVPALIPVARTLLKDPDEGIRSMAAEALGAFGDKESIAAMLPLLTAKDEVNRASVKAGLKALGYELPYEEGPSKVPSQPSSVPAPR